MRRLVFTLVIVCCLGAGVHAIAGEQVAADPTAQELTLPEYLQQPATVQSLDSVDLVEPPGSAGSVAPDRSYGLTNWTVDGWERSDGDSEPGREVVSQLDDSLFGLGTALDDHDDRDAETELELEAALDDDEDTETVSYTFETDENATEATVFPPSVEEDDVVFEFDEWEEINGLRSGSTPSFTVTGDTRYRIIYEVTAESGTAEDTYEIVSSVSTDKAEYQQTLSATVEELEPEFDQLDSENVDITFRPEDDSVAERSVGVELINTGDGEMKLDGDDSVEFSGSGPDISPEVSERAVPDRIGANRIGDLGIEIEVEDDIDEGDHEFEVTVTDNLDNEVSFTVTVSVTKPPAAGVNTGSVDVGEVFPGETTSAQFELRERNEYNPISGIEPVFLSESDDGSIDFPRSRSIDIAPGSTGRQDVEISADRFAQQGQRLEWNARFEPLDNDGIATQRPVSFTAEVIYPPYYEEISVSDANFVFDEARETIDSFDDTVTLSITNGGGVEMDITDISASVGSPEIDATVRNSLQSIPAGGSGTFDVHVEASPDANERTSDPGTNRPVPLELEVTAEEPATLPDETTGTARTEATVTVEHETELGIDQNQFELGEIIVLEGSVCNAATLTETLSYQEVDDFSVEKVSGPEEGWLTIVDRPESLSAGASEEFTFSVEFDTSAELYTTYVWEFEVSGANIDDQTITVQAVPRPIDFSGTIQELEQTSGAVSGELADIVRGMADSLTALEDRLQQEDSSAVRGDIAPMIAAGRSTILLVESAEQGMELVDEDDHEAAQESIVRAFSAFNTLEIATSELNEEQLQSQTESIKTSAQTILDDLFAAQQDHFQQELEQPDVTTLEEARIKRALARLATLRGDEERATRFRSEASEAFDQYSTLVSNANEQVITARESREELDEDLLFSVAGQRLFWVSSLSRFETESDRILGLYDDAIENLEQAGATERAETVISEREEVAQTYDTAYLVSLGLGVGFGLFLVVLIAWEIRGIYRYRLDSEAAVSGDFLLPWAETT